MHLTPPTNTHLPPPQHLPQHHHTHTTPDWPAKEDEEKDEAAIDAHAKSSSEVAKGARDPTQLERSRAALETLEQETDARGRKIKVHKLRAPRRGTATTMRSTDEARGLEDGAGRSEGEPLPASYCNFYIANKCVVVPAFGDAEADEAAARVLRGLFRGRREVVQLRSAREILLGGGNIHCVTQQQPSLQNRFVS